MTRREFTTWALIARGLTNQAIAAELHVSARSVERHVNGVYTALGFWLVDQKKCNKRVMAMLKFYG